MADAAPATVAVAVSQPDHVTVNVVATVAAPAESAKPPANVVATTAAAASPAKAAEDKKPAATNPEPKQDSGSKKDDSKPQQQPSSVGVFQRQPDDFYNTIFYFSGMGSVIGSALAEGIYVDEKNRRNAIDAEIIEASASGKGRRPEELVVTARGQAQGLSTEFHRLHGLLDSLPIYTGTAQAPSSRASAKRDDVDQPIHGELYFRCKERFPVQPTTGGSGSGSVGGRSSHRSSQDGGIVVGGYGSSTEEPSRPRRRQQYDDGTLADVARAAVDAFPLLPPPRSASRGPSPAGSLQHASASPSPAPGSHRDGESSRRRRPQQHDDGSSSSYYDGGDAGGRPPMAGQRGGGGGGGGGGQTVDGIKSWQMSHVRQYEVGGYP